MVQSHTEKELCPLLGDLRTPSLKLRLEKKGEQSLKLVSKACWKLSKYLRRKMGRVELEPRGSAGTEAGPWFFHGERRRRPGKCLRMKRKTSPLSFQDFISETETLRFVALAKRRGDNLALDASCKAPCSSF